MTSQQTAPRDAAAIIRHYYDACNRGDIDALIACFTDDVVHWFLAPNLAPAPVAGAEHLARYWRAVQRKFAGRWVVDHVLAAGDEAVIEWTLYWTPPDSEARLRTRGTEWYVFEAESPRIREIRAYYHQGDAHSELEGFLYAERGYSLDG